MPQGSTRSSFVQVFDECRSNADFLRILMQYVASSQGVQRWAVWAPDNLLYVRTIKAQMPEECAGNLERFQFHFPFYSTARSSDGALENTSLRTRD